MSDFLGSYLLHSTVILALTLGLLRLAAFRSPALRDTALRVALVAGLFTAALSPLQRQTVTLAAPVSAEQTTGRQGAAQGRGPEDSPQPRSSAPTRRPMNWAAPMLLGGLVCAALRLLAAWTVIRRARGRRVDEGDLRASLQTLRASHPGSAALQLFWTQLPVPCAVGRRTILLPHDLRQRLSARELEAVLAHEYAHLLRRDPLWNLALSLLSQVLWFQPLNWLALQAWRDATERQCDAWAVRHTSRLTLAQAILTLARQHRPRVPALLTRQAASHTNLSGRIHALLDPQETPVKRSRLVLALLPATLGAVTPPLTFAASVPTPRTIVLDAAHGGEDPGAVGYANEAQTVLSLARKVRAQLEKNGVTVVMARDSDTKVSLEDRIARIPANAAAYVSLHANASRNPADRGPETFIAAPEVNRSFAASQRLGHDLQAALLSAAGTRNTAPRLGSGTFYVLRNSPVPAALIEVGYVTNAAEGKALQTAAYQDRLAAAIARGLLKQR